MRQGIRPLLLALLPLAAAGAAIAAISASAASAAPRPPGGGAITGLKLVLPEGREVENGTIVWRDGTIVAAGAASEVKLPADVVARDGQGWTAYPGLIEIFDPREPAIKSPEGEGLNLELPADPLPLADDVARNRKLREAGFVLSLVTTKPGILRGESHLFTLGEGRAEARRLERDVAETISLRTADDGYPSSLMGAVAGVRQAFSDALWLPRAEAAFALDPAQPRPEGSERSRRLLRAARGEMPVLFQAQSPLGALRAAALAHELGLKAWLAGSGREYEQLATLRSTALPQIAPLRFPEMPSAPAEGERGPELDELRDAELAPENPGRLLAAGLPVALSSFRNDEPKSIYPALARTLRRGLTEAQALTALTTTPARLLGLEKRFGALAPGRSASFVLVEGGLFVESPKIREVWIEGTRYPVDGDEKKGEGGKKEEEKKEPAAVEGAAVAMEPGVDPLSAWRTAPPLAPKSVLIRHATIWTSAAAGRLENADLLVRDGKIDSVGAGIAVPEGALVIEGQGLEVTAGIIDCHSHTGVEGDVNEGTHTSTAEVRIADVLDSGDVGIYRQLAGGVTVANVLHGSANAIGGQNAVVKRKWGAPPAELLFAAAPPGIKFALGENPKQSNWGVKPADRRFPQTRMGVEQAIRERFLAARDYAARQAEFAALPAAQRERRVPPRRDFELDALAEILAGRRLVHAHSYRADEVLMLLGLADSFGFHVATLQHILEGYKVADEIARHGAGASSFSDWWAYKYEVIDAIPWNGAILHDRGVVVSFNSDSDELARRLNLEAAKAVRYGGLPETEALDFVTINPAKQLRIDSRVGSLEPGKDADFVIWSGSPLSTFSHVEQTWIEGRRYFDRNSDLEARQRLERERLARIAALVPPKKDAKPETAAAAQAKGAAR